MKRPRAATERSRPRLLATASATMVIMAIAGSHGGCAQITTRSYVEIFPLPNAAPRTFGAGVEPLAQPQLLAAWRLAGDTLEVVLTSHPLCRTVVHRPVAQIERVERKAGQAIYWEYGLAAASLALGLLGLIEPELFSRGGVDRNGETVEERQTGLRIGTTFTVLAAVPLAAGIADTIRARDTIHERDAYTLEYGEPKPCQREGSAWADRPVVLTVGGHVEERATDPRGYVSFPLPNDLQGSSATLETAGNEAAIELSTQGEAELKPLAEGSGDEGRSHHPGSKTTSDAPGGPEQPDGAPQSSTTGSSPPNAGPIDTPAPNDASSSAPPAATSSSEASGSPPTSERQPSNDAPSPSDPPRTGIELNPRDTASEAKER